MNIAMLRSAGARAWRAVICPALLGCALAVTLVWTAPAGAATVEESFISARLPAKLRPVCLPVDPATRTPTAIAVLRCDLLANEGVTATFESFRSHVAAGDRYKALLLSGPGLELDRGRCPATLPAESVYNLGRYPAGRYACFRGAAGEATLAWTHAPTGIVAVATRPDGNIQALESWWGSSGPLGDVENRLLAIGGLFPDPYEVALAFDLPPATAATCFRGKAARRKTLIQARLECQGASGKIGVFYERYATRALAERSYRRFLRNVKVPLNAGRCGRDLPAEERYSVQGRPRGRLACFLDAGFAGVQWFDANLRITGLAVRRGKNVRSVLGWWERNG